MLSRYHFKVILSSYNPFSSSSLVPRACTTGVSGTPEHDGVVVVVVVVVVVDDDVVDVVAGVVVVVVWSVQQNMISLVCSV